MIATLIVAASFVAQAPVAVEPKTTPSAPKTQQSTPANPLQDPILAQLKAFATQEIDPTLSKTKQAALRKKINRAKIQYNQRLRQLQDQAERERLLPLMLKQQELENKQQAAAAQNNALMRNAAANEANARANQENAEINRQRLLRELYPQYYGGR